MPGLFLFSTDGTIGLEGKAQETDMVRKSASGRIKITEVPEGEAPRWVRQAWVGLVLPSGPVCGMADEPARGVISNTKLGGVRYEFDVPQREALEILGRASPRAAAWWRAHGFPRGNDWFGFKREEAEVISGVTMQKLVVYDNMETGSYRPVLVINPPINRTN